MIAQIDPGDAWRRMQEGACLVDVREDDETAVAHVPGAMHLPISRFQAGLETLPTDRPLLFLCAAGARSQMAAGFVFQHGYKDVANIKGGMHAWAALGLPLEHRS